MDFVVLVPVCNLAFLAAVSSNFAARTFLYIRLEFIFAEVTLTHDHLINSTLPIFFCQSSYASHIFHFFLVGTSFDDTIMEALRAKLENKNGGKESRRLFTIDGASEFKYSPADNVQKKLLICAVPSYRKGNSWNDYVLIPWKDEGTEHLLAKVLVILDYDTCIK